MNTTNEITEMKDELKIKLSPEQSSRLYPSIPVLEGVSNESQKLSKGNSFWAKLFLGVLATWVTTGIPICVFFKSNVTVFPLVLQELGFKSFVLLYCAMLPTLIGSPIIILLSRFLSKFLTHAIIASFIGTILGLLFLIGGLPVYIFFECNCYKPWPMLVPFFLAILISLTLLRAFIIMVRNSEKKDIDTIASIIEDTSEVIFLPCTALIAVLGFLILSMASVFFITIAMVLSDSDNIPNRAKTGPILIGLFLINFCSFIWTFFFILDSTNLALMLVITRWKSNKRRNALNTWNILSEIVLNLGRGFGHLAYGSSFMSILKQLVIIFESPYRFSNYFCGKLMILTGFFNAGTYIMYAMKKKGFSSSAKTFASDILFKSPLKTATYVMVNLYYCLLLFIANSPIIIFEIAMGFSVQFEFSKISGQYGQNFDIIWPVIVLIPIFAVLYTVKTVFNTLAVHSLNVENNRDSIIIDINK